MIDMGDAPGGQFGHADRLTRDRPDPTPGPGGVCRYPHPLLEDVRCQRLHGHPGRHRANAESTHVEFDVEWGGEESKAG